MQFYFHLYQRQNTFTACSYLAAEKRKPCENGVTVGMRTCDNCGRRFELTNFNKDRCPVCCPKEDNESGDVWEIADDLAPEPD